VIAVGGAAVGYYATGGGAWGVHPFGGNVQDPVAKEFFTSFPINAQFVLQSMGYMGMATAVVMCLAFGTVFAFEYRRRRKNGA
jgi:hypothetical protein